MVLLKINKLDYERMKQGELLGKYLDGNYEDVGGFWDKLKEYEKDNDVYLKGN